MRAARVPDARSEAPMDFVRQKVMEDWKTGKITEEKIQQAILRHREQHPYR